jgi:hypothetical protein
MPRRTVEEIAKDVLEYFVRNPKAADDLEGVARWRLFSQMVHRDVEDTSLALDWLVQQGYLDKVARAGCGAIFQLRQEQRTEAEAFLARAESEEK